MEDYKPTCYVCDAPATHCLLAFVSREIHTLDGGFVAQISNDEDPDEYEELCAACAQHVKPTE